MHLFHRMVGGWRNKSGRQRGGARARLWRPTWSSPLRRLGGTGAVWLKVICSVLNSRQSVMTPTSQCCLRVRTHLLACAAADAVSLIIASSQQMFCHVVPICVPNRSVSCCRALVQLCDRCCCTGVARSQIVCLLV